MQSSGTVRTELLGTVGVITLSGEVSSTIEEVFLKAYNEVTSAGSTKILLRFNEKCFINSAGIALVIMIVSKARDVSQKVGVVGLSTHYQKIFEMIGLTDFLTIFQGEDAALKLL
ncbi:MAG: STAS domain-containing protein [bacterium]